MLRGGNAYAAIMAVGLIVGCGGGDGDDDDDDDVAAVDAAVTPPDATPASDASPPDAEPVDCTQPPSGYDKKWVGATSTDWSVATNWDPEGVPTASSNVFICSDAANQPVLTASSVANDLLIAGTAQLDTATFQLTLTGDLDGGNTIVGSGPVIMTGADTTANGTVGTLRITAAVSAGPALVVPGLLDIDPGAQFDIAGQTVVAGDVEMFVGYIVMDGASDELVIEGDLTSAADVSMLSAGVIRLSGDLTTQSNQNNFASTGTRVELVGTSAQTLNMIFTDATSNRFTDLVIDNPAGVTIAMGLYADNVTVTDTAGPITGGASTVEIAGDLTMTDGTQWQVGETRFSKESPGLPAQLGGGIRFSGPTHALASDIDVTGSLFAQRSGQDVDLNGHSVTVSGGATVGLGRLVMQSSADELTIGGAFVSQSDTSADAALTAGTIHVAGNMSLGGNGNNFRSGGTLVDMNGTSPQTIDFFFTGASSNHFADLSISMGADVSFITSVYITGGLSIDGTATVDAARTVTVEGTLVMSSGATLHNNGTMSVGACTIAAGATITGTNPCP